MNIKEKFKSGFVAIVGKPNVGKSTFLNYIIGRKVSITSRKPQTTRFQVLGIKTTPDYQIVFVDTPGFYPARHLLGEKLLKYAKKEAHSSDIVIFMIDSSRPLDEDDRSIADFLKYEVKNSAIYIAANKIDLLKAAGRFDKFFLDLQSKGLKFLGLDNFRDIFYISSVTGEGFDILQGEIAKALPIGVKYFPDDAYTDKDQRTQISEIIREKAIILTRQEVPHSLAVDVEITRPGKGGNIAYIYAVIYLEKPSQKGILIGRGGEMLKKLGTSAREEIEKLLNKKVFLDLRVKVKKDWRKKKDFLKYLGYD